MKKCRRKNAQQVVEFLLVAPFLIGFLALFTEYAYALNINLTLTKTLKESTQQLYHYARPNMTSTDLTEQVKKNFIKRLENYNIPTEDENNINIAFFTNNKIGIFQASYTYYPAFTLPEIFFKVMPDKFQFMTTSAVPIGLLQNNNYTGGVDSKTLDKIWSASNFSELNSFDGAKNGILKNEKGRDRILFLVPATDNNDMFMLVKWDSSFVFDENNNYYLYTTQNKFLHSCSPSTGQCSETQKNIFDYLRTNNYNYIYIVNDSLVPKSNIGTLSSVWNVNNYIDLSHKTAEGILKRTISITDSKSMSIGNYDNIDTTSFCIDACGKNTSPKIKIYPFGSMIFIDSSSTIKDNITSGQSRVSFSDFGGGQ